MLRLVPACHEIKTSAAFLDLSADIRHQNRAPQHNASKTTHVGVLLTKLGSVLTRGPERALLGTVSRSSGRDYSCNSSKRDQAPLEEG